MSFEIFEARKPMGLMAGKVALVTGAGTGIGRAAALKFAEEGAKVVVSDVNSTEGNETVALIRQATGDAVFVRADVTEAAAVEALIASAVAAFGRLDCACNNAGIEGRVVPLAEQSEEDSIQSCLSMPRVHSSASSTSSIGW
jgi:NAD(P)-dependent dehydrogenase (short-subunit alcohol dehydrogenase family)